MNRRSLIGAAAACCALCMVAAGCGRKTDPLTPDSPRPAAVAAVTVAVRDNIAYLSWPLPATNIEGRNLPPGALGGFRVYRAELDAARAGKRPRYRELAFVSVAAPAPAEIKKGVVTWSDPGLAYGRLYGYRIRAVSAGGDAGPYSEEVRVAPLLSLSAPKGLAASAADGVVALTWTAVTTRSDGSRHQGFIGYNIYRGSQAGARSEAPLNPEPVRSAEYRDRAVVNDTAYYYTVRAVDSPVQPWKESLDSAEAGATPRDQTPPDAPKGLTVVPGVGRAFVTWNENNERDLAGYHLYRSARSGGGFHRLTDKPLNRTTYSDETVKPGATYVYTVTAVDAAGNESAASKEQHASIEKMR